MFLARYAIAPCPLRSVDEVDDAGAEVRLATRGLGRGDTGPHDLGEPAGDRPGRAARREAGQVEPDPGDHVVLRVGARPAERVVDGEEQLRADAGLEGALHLRGVPLRTGVRE